MLNKLLKRCMPWMDKGRWETIFINKIEGKFVIDMEKSSPGLAHDFVDVSPNEHNKTLAFIFQSDKGITYKVKDFRFSCVSPFLYTNSDYRCTSLKFDNTAQTFLESHTLYDFAPQFTSMQLDLFVERVIL